jgi:hypothetical protein
MQKRSHKFKTSLGDDNSAHGKVRTIRWRECLKEVFVGKRCKPLSVARSACVSTGDVTAANADTLEAGAVGKCQIPNKAETKIAESQGEPLA